MCLGTTEAHTRSSRDGNGVRGLMSGRQRITIWYLRPRNSSPVCISWWQLAQRCTITTFSTLLVKPRGQSNSEVSRLRPVELSWNKYGNNDEYEYGNDQEYHWDGYQMFMQSISRIVTIGRSASQEIVVIITVRYMVAFNTHELNTGLQRARFVHEERVKLEF
jgi:hypothetical protein